MSDALRLRCVFAFLMSLVMTLLMSAWVTWLNIGWQADFLPRWRHAPSLPPGPWPSAP